MPRGRKVYRSNQEKVPLHEGVVLPSKGTAIQYSPTKKRAFGGVQSAMSDKGTLKKTQKVP